MNKIKNLMEQQIERFIREFKNSSKKLFFNPENNRLIHPGEYGIYIE
ncbi:hypothetical protein [Ornithinibacillus bavariensis]|uniref:Uncharacterized protein n=1 Tax=Ornithinibacillus bavariensis TaxID=545502 RepID=A0A919XBC7_9BACI|nr:hypothetical protein [Ornithinibacillus bavariensis]GIO27468.1 hypothetical protein J43TS3_20790 [Ornithinibacillus bavariensis]